MNLKARLSWTRLLTLVVLLFSSPALLHCGGKSGSSAKQEDRLWIYKKKHTNMYSWKDDIQLGEQVLEKQLAEFEKKGIAVNPPEQLRLRRRINRIVKKLAKVSDYPSLPYEVHIFDMPEVANAFCLPGGKIGVFTGIFDPEKGLINKKSDDEIAAVLGHEIAHATMRHVTRRLTTYNSLGVLGSIISVGIGQSAGASTQSLFETVFQTGASLYFPSYSRKYEREADKVGFYYLAKAGFDPKAAIAIWARVDKRRKGAKTSFFATHPSGGERAKNLTRYLQDAYAVQGKTDAK